MSTTRFGVYELGRIVLPGLYVMFLGYLYIAIFSVPFYPFDTAEFAIPLFFIGACIAGLTLYAKESPKKRKAFQSNQPSRYLLERSVRLNGGRTLSEDESRHLYFYILNRHIDPPFHEKIFVFGMIYQIMISIRRTSFWFGMVGLVLLGARLAMTSRMNFAVALPVALVWLVYALNVRYNKADRKMQENYQDQIFWLKMNGELVDGLILQMNQIAPDE